MVYPAQAQSFETESPKVSHKTWQVSTLNLKNSGVGNRESGVGRIKTENGDKLPSHVSQVPIFRPDDQPQLPSETPPELPSPTPLPDSEELLIPSPPLPETPDSSVPGAVPDSITVERFDFEGNTIITDEELAAATAEFTNRPLSFAEVFEVRSAIIQLYQDRGYLTSGAVVPPQTFTGGAVKIQIIEGGLEAINVTGTRRLNPNYIKDRIALGISTPLNRDSLLETLQLLQLNPLIQDLSAELSAGTRPGSSLLTVKVTEAKSFNTELALNNNRSPTIGTFERQLTLTEANLLGQGDSLSLVYSNTPGSNALKANYTYPLNPRNGTLSLSLGTTFSNVVESPFDRIELEADSSYYELTYRQPLSRSLNQEFALGVTATYQGSQVTTFDVPVRLSPGADEDGRTRVSALRFFQDWTKRNNREVFALRSQFSLGLGILNATVNDDGPDSHFIAWRGQAQWARLLAAETLLLLRADVQLTTQPLLGLEQFGVGGQDTVRGYRQNALLTDNGALVSAEIRYPILRLPRQNGLLQLAAFVDFGTSWNNSDNPEFDPDPGTLFSTGLGLRFRLGNRLTARLDWGIPLVSLDSRGGTLQEDGIYFSVVSRPF
ncbi:MAG: ShlB/FhaC/HecB family hemolysin secretion/activation protein [Coleofasciculaceae cyanobacterium]